MENIKPETLKRKLEKPSHYVAKLAEMPADWKPPTLPADHEAHKMFLPGYFRNRHIFFYGTLMDKSNLAKVLGLSLDDERLKLRPARITGYHTKLWGPYPALLHGPQGSHVYGVAFEAQSQDELEQLAAYETDKYVENFCLIEFLDNEDKEPVKKMGRTFVWNGSAEELTGGKFCIE